MAMEGKTLRNSGAIYTDFVLYVCLCCSLSGSHLSVWQGIMT